jgi:ribonuclease HII
MVKSYPTLDEERALLQAGCQRIAGLDEAGRGAWAGPVVAAAIILPLEDANLAGRLDGVCDSKLCTPRQRDLLYDRICEVALAWGAASVPASRIDEIGIVPSVREAMREALSQLVPAPDALLIDALRLPAIRLLQRALPKGDRKCLSIAAASILAKVTRDRQMVALDREYPQYGLGRHKGYGTSQHQLALDALGPTTIHRWSYAPVSAAAMGIKRTQDS